MFAIIVVVVVVLVALSHEELAFEILSEGNPWNSYNLQTDHPMLDSMIIVDMFPDPSSDLLFMSLLTGLSTPAIIWIVLVVLPSPSFFRRSFFALLVSFSFVCFLALFPACLRLGGIVGCFGVLNLYDVMYCRTYLYCSFIFVSSF